MVSFRKRIVSDSKDCLNDNNVENSISNAESLSKHDSTDLKNKTEQIEKVTEKWDSKPSHEYEFDDGVCYFEDVLISKIVPDKTNARTRFILHSNPTQNKLDKTHPNHEENEDLINDLKEFSEHLKTTQLKQPIGLIKENGKYKILFGNRRYYAMKIAYGDKVKISAKIFKKEPSLSKAIRFIENEARSSLSLAARLLDFKSAYENILSLKTIKKSKIYEILNLKKTNYYKLQKIVENTDVFEAIQNNKIKEMAVAYNLIRDIHDIDIRSDVIEIICDKNYSIADAYKEYRRIQNKNNKDITLKEKKKKNSLSFPKINGIKQASTILQKIIDGHLKDMDWNDVDWEDIDSIENRLKANIHLLLLENADMEDMEN